VPALATFERIGKVKVNKRMHKIAR
jgi:hypothetical protein